MTAETATPAAELSGLAGELAEALPGLRGRLRSGVSMAEITWFRVGGPAEVLFTPADEADLIHFLQNAPEEVPVTVVGVGSNLLVRDGGVRGVVIRLGRGFSEIEALDEAHIRCGAAVPDVRLAQAAARAEIGRLAFYRGIPGSIGGALRMNAGAHGTETRDVLVQARAVDRRGQLHVLGVDELSYGYRHCGAPLDFIFTQATFQGEPSDRDVIEEAMREVADYREAHQPTKARTGGSTFKNPPGHSAWRLVDAAGCRGLRLGGAHVSELHCNFLINDGDATAADIEELGETVRERVRAISGVSLEWEIKRIGEQAARTAR